MKKLALLLASMLIAGQAGAKSLDWHGSLNLEMVGGMRFTLEGSGVATVNDSSGSAHLSTLRLAGGITGATTVPATDPSSTGTIKSIRVLSATLGTATLSGISGAPPIAPPATLPVRGQMRVCLFSTECSAFLPFDLTQNNGNTGVGVGGLLTIGGNGSIRISYQAAPWTLATVSGLNQTVKGNFETLTRVGFVHGAASASGSSTATNSGVIQMVSPQQASTVGIPGNRTRVGLFSTLTLHFIPEPGLLLLIGAGAVGLGLVGRSRMKK